MAGGYSVQTAICNLADYGTATASSEPGLLTSNGSANVKGSYTQLTASTGSDAVGLFVYFTTDSASAAQYSVDIAIGGAGSEQVIVPDLIVCADHNAAPAVFLPLVIPSGTRVAARCQDSSGGQQVRCSVCIADGEFVAQDGMAAVDTYGFSSGTTKGTSVDPGGTVNTKGAWAQLTASTTNDICGLVVALDSQQVTGGSSVFATLLLDIGIGGAGSEVVLLPNLLADHLINNGSVNTTLPDYYPLIPVSVPDGTRIAARCQSSDNTATSRVVGVVVYGVRAIA